MLELINVNDCPGISIPLTYKLLLERPMHANISHKNMPDMELHRSFVQNHPYKFWALVRSDDAAWGCPDVGAIYLSKQNEIGIAILKEYQGKGYATAAIKELMAKHGRLQYLANVAPQNEASHSLFRKLGGKIIQMTYQL